MVKEISWNGFIWFHEYFWPGFFKSSGPLFVERPSFFSLFLRCVQKTDVVGYSKLMKKWWHTLLQNEKFHICIKYDDHDYLWLLIIFDHLNLDYLWPFQNRQNQNWIIFDHWSKIIQIQTVTDILICSQNLNYYH